MKILQTFYLIGLFVITIFGSPIATPQLSLNNSTSEHCSGGLIGLFTLKPGEYMTIKGICIKAMCDEYLELQYHGCATYIIDLPKYCKYIYLKMDSENEYPDCCPYVDCYGPTSSVHL